METKEHIECIIRRTFEVVQSVYDNQKEAEGRKDRAPIPRSRIIYPKYRNNKTRFCEQELRFIFVEQLNEEISNGWDVYYSIETPTTKRYKFKDEPNPKVYGEDEKGGQSAQFDLVIHNNKFQRIALIEFKANNTLAQHHIKDFVKLNEEGLNDILTFFLEIVRSSDNDTVESLKNKKESFKGEFRCWSCSEGNYIIK